MTPKEKAQQLYDKFYRTGLKITFDGEVDYYEETHIELKNCALICVDEILDGFRKLLPSSRAYWEEVRKEIENL